MENNSYRKVIIIGSIVAILIIAVSVIFALRPEEKKGKQNSQNPLATEIPDSSSISPGTLSTVFDGIITGLDLDSSCLTVNELGTDQPYTLYYTGGTDIRTRTDRPISAALLQKGDIVSIVSTENHLTSLYGSKAVWTYKNVGNLTIDPDIGKMTVGSNIYHYDKSLKILNNGEFADLSSLSSLDMLTLYGIEDYIYLIKVTSGHGTLSFANDSDFIGGALSYNKGKTVEFTENMKVTLAEGEYDIRVEHLEYSATATVKISNGRSTCFDLFDYGAKPVAYGNVSFTISPRGSELYVDGIKTAYSEPVKMAFGDHSIEVSLGGYTSYYGVLTVDRTGISKRIVLSEAPVIEEPEEDLIYDLTEASTGSENETSPGTASDTSVTEADTPSSDSADAPDSTTDDGDLDDLEIIDGDSDEPYQNGSYADDSATTAPDTSESENVLEQEPDEEPEITEPPKPSESSGTMTIYTSNDTTVQIDGEYAGTVKDGLLTIPKPSGTVVISLSREGYVSKHYTITLDPEEENVSYKFPDMTKEH